jgi:hypothetical protein
MGDQPQGRRVQGRAGTAVDDLQAVLGANGGLAVGTLDRLAKKRRGPRSERQQLLDRQLALAEFLRAELSDQPLDGRRIDLGRRERPQEFHQSRPIHRRPRLAQQRLIRRRVSPEAAGSEE